LKCQSQPSVELLDYLQLARRKDAYPARHSGGEAQHVAITSALANNPRLVLADGPKAALDSLRASVVMDLLMRKMLRLDLGQFIPEGNGLMLCHLMLASAGSLLGCHRLLKRWNTGKDGIEDGGVRLQATGDHSCGAIFV
jgi:ABC-type arginine transport system ATPase subunit